jgi:hypothetical protein
MVQVSIQCYNRTEICLLFGCNTDPFALILLEALGTGPVRIKIQCDLNPIAPIVFFDKIIELHELWLCPIAPIDPWMVMACPLNEAF